MRSVATIDLEPRRSRGFAIALVAVLVLAGTAIALLDPNLPRKVALAVLTLAAGVFAWRAHRRHAATRLTLRGDGRAAWRAPGDAAGRAGVLVAHVRLGALVTLTCRPDGGGGVVRLAWWRDMFAPADWHALQRLLGSLRDDAPDSHIV